MNFSIRYLEQGDLEWLRDLRNLERAHFFNKLEISRDQQEYWWRSAAWGDERWLIHDANDPRRRVGYFSIVSPKPDLPVFPTDGRPVRYFSTMLIAPEWRGHGALLSADPCFDIASHCYVGYVQEGNHVSMRACAKLKFHSRGRYVHPTYGTMHIVWRDQ